MHMDMDELLPEKERREMCVVDKHFTLSEIA